MAIVQRSTRAQILRHYRQRVRQSLAGAIGMAVLSVSSFAAVANKITTEPLELVIMFVGGIAMAAIALLALVDASEHMATLAKHR